VLWPVEFDAKKAAVFKIALSPSSVHPAGQRTRCK